MSSPTMNSDTLQVAIDEARGRAPSSELAPAVVKAAIKLEQDNLKSNRALVVLVVDRLIERGLLRPATPDQ